MNDIAEQHEIAGRMFSINARSAARSLPGRRLEEDCPAVDEPMHIRYAGRRRQNVAFQPDGAPGIEPMPGSNSSRDRSIMLNSAPPLR
jgi:hypothetical protein